VSVNAIDVDGLGVQGSTMSWDAPERRWEFPIGENPPSDLPAAWASASRAVTRDLGCRLHGRRISFHNVLWTILTDNGSVCVGFELAGDADVSAYRRCLEYRLDTTTAQATVWMADDVQYELGGYELVQWPIAGQHTLIARIIDDQAVWMEPKTGAVISPIGQLCQAPHTPAATG
jgi:hypothetical protein